MTGGTQPLYLAGRDLGCTDLGFPSPNFQLRKWCVQSRALAGSGCWSPQGSRVATLGLSWSSGGALSFSNGLVGGQKCLQRHVAGLMGTLSEKQKPLGPQVNSCRKSFRALCGGPSCPGKQAV